MHSFILPLGAGGVGWGGWSPYQLTSGAGRVVASLCMNTESAKLKSCVKMQILLKSNFDHLKHFENTQCVW